MLARSAAGIICSILIANVSRVAEGAKIKLIPLRASGIHFIQNGELYLKHPSQQIVLEIQVSDWALDGDGLLHNAMAQIESEGFSNGVGAPLLPVYQSCPTEGDVGGFCDSEFGSSGRSCLATSGLPGCPYTNCCQPAFIDRAHPQYLHTGVTAGNFVDSDNPDLSFRYSAHCICVGISDNGSARYAGTLLLEVASEAAGTYTIRFRESGTFLLDGDNPFEVPMPYTQTPAVIHVENFAKNRYVTFGSSAGEGTNTAIRVTLSSLYHPDPPPPVAPAVPPDFSSFEGQIRWVGQPAFYMETPNPFTAFTAAPLQCEPFFASWIDWGLIHAFGTEVVPDSQYELDEVDESCPDLTDPNCYTRIATLRTSRWGDIELPFAVPGSLAQPDFADVSSIVRKFRQQPGAPITARTSIYGDMTDQGVDFQDVSAAVDSFKGRGFPYSGPADCP